MFREKRVIIIAIIVVLLSVATLILVYMDQKTKSKNILIESNQEVETEIETSTELNKLTLDEQEIVAQFLKDNISNLSPEKEVLGGKFYITSIDFLDENNLIIEYEDGHIALVAKVEFEYLKESDIEIKKFEIFNQ